MTLAMKRAEWEEEAEIYRLIKTSMKYNASHEDIVSDLCSELDLTKEEAEEAIRNFNAENCNN